MNRLIKFYNQNRYIIWIVILVLVAIIALIQILNNFASKKISMDNTVTQNVITDTYFDKNYSVITGKDIKAETSQIIDDFINYCNNKELEKAYGLLSDECKKILYPTLEDFTKKYYNKLFTNKKTYLYQAWITNKNKYTYKVDFLDDMLATGTASSTSITDYYTIEKNNNNYRLNINKFIGTTDINKVQTKDNVTIKINRKKIYMDYEIYEIQVLNNSSKQIRLDNLQNTDSVFLEDENKQEHYWFSHEILEEDITIRKAQGKEVEIKFNKVYIPENQAIKMVFSKINLNNKTSKFEISL